MKRNNNRIYYLNSGVYTVREASSLIDVSTARLRRWIHGDTHNYNTQPLITNEIEEINRKTFLSFVNLIEALFVSKFSSYGVHVKSIRRMAEETSDFLGTEHPFATDILFKTDGQKIFAQIERETEDPKLYDLKKRNWAMEPILGRGLVSAISYNETGIARRWYPRPKQAPHVVLNPAYSFGKPVLDESGIPVKTIYEAYIAEDYNQRTVAKWFEIPVSHVKEAVRFQRTLDAV